MQQTQLSEADINALSALKTVLCGCGERRIDSISVLIGLVIGAGIGTAVMLGRLTCIS